jgi:hypothetical protein
MDFNELIRSSKDLEAGRITQDEFDYKRRALQANAQSQIEQQREQQRRDEAAQGAAFLATSAALFQAGQPQPVRPAPTYPNSIAPAASTGLTGFLNSQEVNGTLRYCKYSNGVIRTISSVSLCPLQTDGR